MDKDFETYDNLIEFVKKHSDAEELARINSEDFLFRERGWENYILLLANIFMELKGILCIKGLSAMDSYLLFKSNDPERKSIKLLQDETSRGILFNDALRLSIDVVNAVENELPKFVKKVSDVLENNLLESGMKYQEDLLPNDDNSLGNELIIVGNNQISNAERTLILNERKDSTEEENAILRKYLLIKINARYAL